MVYIASRTGVSFTVLRIAGLASALLYFSGADCGASGGTGEAGRPAAEAGSGAENSRAFTNEVRSFQTRGVIREILPGEAALRLTHEEIAGFMPRMTMKFDVRDTNELRGLRVGDRIAFKLRATETESWIDEIDRAGTNVLGEALASEDSSDHLLRAATLKPGDPLPDFELLAEHGRTIRFSDFAGEAVALTFIFTRCPLPDFCPRMNDNFARARELLIQSPEAPVNWQLLSISFDPEFDTPGVLARYATRYRGEFTDHWLFAAAGSDVLSAVSPLLDFRQASEQGSFQHNLRTVVLDPGRRVYRYFEGNKWTAEELARALMEAAQLGGQP